MKVHFIYHRIGHHSDHSGYDQLVRYIPHEGIAQTFLGRVLDKVSPETKERWARSTPLTWYTQKCLRAEADVVWKLMRSRRRIFHYLYGEDQYFYLSKVPTWGGNKIIVSYHQPPSFFSNAVGSIDHIRKVDAVIAVSQDQGEFFASKLGKDRVFFVPHGVDTGVFRRPEKRVFGETKECLVVGQWLRDTALLKRVIEVFDERNPGDTHFTIVTLERFFKEFQGLKYVTLLSGISEERLIHLYQNSDLLFLPMKDCTANNAVLEAMSCGLPILTTDVGGMRDYLDEKCASFFSTGDVEGAIDSLEGLLGNKERLEYMSLCCRERALKFSWPVVAAQMKEVYRKVLG